MLNEVDTEKFLEEEIRCEYKVDRSRKMLWKIELDIMEKLICVCEKYDLQYFLLGGTAIGAVRHQGFIPWDDDIDLGMKREHFDIFVEKAKEFITDPYELQFFEKDQHFDGILRIRDKNSTGIIAPDWDKKCNSGVFVEIYPLDNVPDNILAKYIQNIKIRFYYGLIIRKIYSFKDSFIKRFIYAFYKNVPVEKLMEKYEKACKKYNNKDTEYCNTLSTPEAARKEINLIKRADIQSAVKVPFEYMELCVPSGNENILRQHYGNYMQLPPVKERGTYHNDTVFYDPFVPYEEYVGSDIIKEYFNK